MPYIGAGIQRFNTADGLTVSGTTDLDGAVVVNESSADADFRVESNGNANMLVVDAGNDRIGIGTNTPAHDVEIVATAAGSVNDSLQIRNNATSNGTGSRIRFINSTDNTSDANGASISSVRNGDDNDLVFETENATRMTIDHAGNVGIGEASPAAPLHVSTAASTTAEIRLTSNNTGSGSGDRGRIAVYSSRNDGTAYEAGRIEIDRSSGTEDKAHILFSTNNGSGVTERMRIDSSGTVLVGSTSFSEDGSTNSIKIHPDEILTGTTSTSANTHLGFSNPNGRVGSIITNGSGTAFNTSSDYRLKENVADMTGAITRVKSLAPKRFNFIADADTTFDGFLAHEAQAVVPEAVTGTHNEVETWTQQQIDDGDAPDGTSAGDNRLDGDGNTIPVMQGIDQSKLVPLLTGALQEAIAKIETLESRLTALEK